MGFLELERFELRGGVGRDDLVAADREAQAWCYLERPGLLRRTTTVAEGGAVVVVSAFGSGAPPADAWDVGGLRALAALVEPGSRRREVVADLDEDAGDLDGDVATAGPA